MSDYPDLPSEVVTRLRAEVEALKFVGEVADLTGLIQNGQLPRQTPAAFVVPVREVAAPHSHGTGRMTQKVNETIAVILVQRSRNDAGGVGKVDSTQSLKHAVQSSLIGFVATNYKTPLEYVSGRLEGLTPDAAMYRLEFTAGRYHRQTSS